MIFDFIGIIELCNTLEPTKGNILRIKGMFYDPLGLISPVTLPVETILQKLLKFKFEWDKKIQALVIYE